MASTWDPKSKFLIDWYKDNRNRMPKPPFRLDLVREVVGPKFYTALDVDIEKGPDSANAKYGALQYKIFLLYKYMKALSEKDTG